MANTQNYGLTLPQGWDRPDRGALAGNLQKLDGALAALNRGAAGLQGNLETMGYNLYNLTLQDYYDGKQTGYKKNLILDGFADGRGGASLTTGLWVDDVQRALRLDGGGQQQDAVNFATSVQGTLFRNKIYTERWRATGYGTLTKVEIYYQGSAWLVILQGETELARVQCVQSYEKQPAVFPVSVPITPGVQYGLSLRVGNENLAVHTAGTQETQFGFRLTFTPKTYTSGTMVSVPFPTTGSVQKALAWVRCQGCTPTPSLKAGSRSLPLTYRGAVACVNHQGAACQERSYTYSGSAVSGPLTVALGVNGSSGTNGYVYDYGVVVL